MKIAESVWITTEPCIINKCRLDMGTLIINPNGLNVNIKNTFDFSVDQNGNSSPNTDTFLVFDEPGCFDWGTKGYLYNGGKELTISNIYDDITHIPSSKFSVGTISIDDEKGEDLNLSTLDLFIGFDNMRGILSNNQYQGLADIGAFNVAYSSRPDVGDVSYMPVKGVRGFYIETGNTPPYAGSKLTWLTKADLDRMHLLSEYGIMKNDNKDAIVDFDDNCTKLLKIISAVHSGKLSEVDGKVIGDVDGFVPTLNEFSNIHNAILNCDVTDNALPSYVSDEVYIRINSKHNDYDFMGEVRTYVGEDTLPNGLKLEPFNMLFDSKSCGVVDDFADMYGVKVKNVSYFALRRINLVTEKSSLMEGRCVYKGDAVLESGKIVKNAYMGLRDSALSSNSLVKIRNMALLSNEYRTSGGDINVDDLKHKYLISSNTGGSMLPYYKSYKEAVEKGNTVSQLYSYNNYTLNDKGQLTNLDKDMALSDFDTPNVDSGKDICLE